MNFYTTDGSVIVNGGGRRNLSQYKFYKYPAVRTADAAVRITLPDGFPVQPGSDGKSWTIVGRVEWSHLKPTVMLRIGGRLRPCRQHDGLPDGLWGFALSNWPGLMAGAGHKHDDATGYVIDPEASFREFSAERRRILDLVAEFVIKAFCPEVSKVTDSAKEKLITHLDDVLDGNFGLSTCVPFMDDDGRPCWDHDPCWCRVPGKSDKKGTGCHFRCHHLPPAKN